MKAIVTDPDDHGLGDALDARGVAVVQLEGVATRESLDAAGLADADLLVLTDMRDATVIAVAKEANPDVRVVTYATDTLPEFARAITDLAVDPALLSADVVADELAD